jgi:hypothetical protein
MHLMRKLRWRSLASTGLSTALAEQRSIATLEFAMVAPIMLTMTIAVFDIGRALIIWQQLNNAASAIAQAAEKFSVTVDPNTGETLTELTPQQMQDAMTSIYAQMPGLALGNGTGTLSGPYSVTLSSVVFSPVCTYADPSKCATQVPYVLWSSYLTEGGVKLAQPPATSASKLLRQCNDELPLTQAATFPNNSSQLSVMINPTLGGTALTLTSQVVADVSYTFYPSFPQFPFMPFKSGVTIYASATMPDPFGGLDQVVQLNAQGGTYNEGTNPEYCTVPNYVPPT